MNSVAYIGKLHSCSSLVSWWTCNNKKNITQKNVLNRFDFVDIKVHLHLQERFESRGLVYSLFLSRVCTYYTTLGITKNGGKFYQRGDDLHIDDAIWHLVNIMTTRDANTDERVHSSHSEILKRGKCWKDPSGLISTLWKWVFDS